GRQTPLRSLAGDMLCSLLLRSTDRAENPILRRVIERRGIVRGGRVRPFPGDRPVQRFGSRDALSVPEGVADAMRIDDPVLGEVEVVARRRRQSICRQGDYVAAPPGLLGDGTYPRGFGEGVRVGDVVDLAGGAVVGDSEGDGVGDVLDVT